MLYSINYQHTNYYFLQAENSRSLLAFDLGWPSSLLQYMRAMKEKNLEFKNISWAIVSHMHMDHAGLLAEFIESNIACMVTPEQFGTIEEMERIITKNDPKYQRINQAGLKIMSVEQLNARLRHCKIPGSVIRTPGHSEDSISLLTSQNEVCIGDLYPIDQIMPDDIKSQESWQTIRTHGGKYIYPSHAPAFEIT